MEEGRTTGRNSAATTLADIVTKEEINSKESLSSSESSSADPRLCCPSLFKVCANTSSEAHKKTSKSKDDGVDTSGRLSPQELLARMQSEKFKLCYQEVSEMYDQHCEESGFHGYKYIAGDHVVFAKIFWSVVVVVGLVCAVFMLWSLSDRNPLINELATTGFYVPNIIFPAITICDVALRSNSSVRSGSKLNVLTYLQKQLHIHPWQRFTKQMFSDGRDFSMTNTTVNSQELLSFLLFKSRTCEEMVAECTWLGKPCDQKFYLTHTPYGFCCSIGFRHGHVELANETIEYFKENKDRLQVPEVEVDLKHNPDELALQYVRDWAKEHFDKVRWIHAHGSVHRAKPLETNGVGWRNGLTLLLSAKPADDEDSPRSFGFYLLVHGSNDNPQLLTPKLPLLLGTEVTAEIEAYEITSDPALNQLGEHIRGCRMFLSDESEDAYSYRNCLTECVAQTVEKLCKCRPFFYSEGEKSPCNLMGMQCFWSYYHYLNEKLKNDTSLSNGKKNQNSEDSCRCEIQCRDDHYKTTLSSNPLFIPGTVESDPRYMKDMPLKYQIDEPNLYYTLLNVYYRQRSTFQYNRRHMYASSNAFPEAGGALSLCSGFSIICLVSLFKPFVDSWRGTCQFGTKK